MAKVSKEASEMSTRGTDSVPVVDFSAYSLEKHIPDEKTLQQLVDDIHNAFTTIGFVYLKNTGCPPQVIKDAFRKSKAFFDLNEGVKLKHRRGDILPKSNFGYVEMEQEGLNPERPYKDLKEAFNFVPCEAERVSAELDKFPVVSDMSRALRNLFDAGNTVQMRVLEIMGLGLELDDPQFLAKKHQFFCKTGTLRSLHYPRLNMKEIKENQVRCGEHSDYGSITLLFQDGKAGLQVRNVHDEWVKAPPIEGTILVNIGDLMQRWTSDRLIASKHRVMLPNTEEENSASRQSIALFGHPDDDEIIACLDGSNKYPPIGSKEYLEMRFSMTY